MKRIKRFGALFAVLVILLVPSISAFEYIAAEETYTKKSMKLGEQIPEIPLVKLFLYILAGIVGWTIGIFLFTFIIHPLLQIIIGY